LPSNAGMQRRTIESPKSFAPNASRRRLSRAVRS
jgi:hypothetical protein